MTGRSCNTATLPTLHPQLHKDSPTVKIIISHTKSEFINKQQQMIQLKPLQCPACSHYVLKNISTFYGIDVYPNRLKRGPNRVDIVTTFYGIDGL